MSERNVGDTLADESASPFRFQNNNHDQVLSPLNGQNGQRFSRFELEKVDDEAFSVTSPHQLHLMPQPTSQTFAPIFQNDFVYPTQYSEFRTDQQNLQSNSAINQRKFNEQLATKSLEAVVCASSKNLNDAQTSTLYKHTCDIQNHKPFYSEVDRQKNPNYFTHTEFGQMIGQSHRMDLSLRPLFQRENNFQHSFVRNDKSLLNGQGFDLAQNQIKNIDFNKDQKSNDKKDQNSNDKNSPNLYDILVGNSNTQISATQFLTKDFKDQTSIQTQQSQSEKFPMEQTKQLNEKMPDKEIRSFKTSTANQNQSLMQRDFTNCTTTLAHTYFVGSSNLSTFFHNKNLTCHEKLPKKSFDQNLNVIDLDATLNQTLTITEEYDQTYMQKKAMLLNKIQQEQQSEYLTLLVVPWSKLTRAQKSVKFKFKRRYLKLKLYGDQFKARSQLKNLNRQKASLNRKRDNLGKFLDKPKH